MSLTALLTKLRQLGVELEVSGQTLTYRAPAETVTPALLAEITAHKQELLVALAGDAECLPYPVRDPDAPIPLAYAQEGLWFLESFYGSCPAYISSTLIRLSAPPDIALLEAAMDSLIARHDALRTVFVPTEHGPQQHVVPAGPFRITSSQAMVAVPQQREFLTQLAAREGRIPFDFNTPPLVRVCLLELGHDTRFLMLTAHHVILDDWSVVLLLQELGALYQSFQIGVALNLPPVQAQFPDFCLWQRRYFTPTTAASALAYWQSRLTAPATRCLAPDHPRLRRQTFAGGSLSLDLGTPITRALYVASADHAVTPFIVALAALNAMLVSLLGPGPVTVGIPTANRRNPFTHGTVGYFSNVVVLRTAIPLNASPVEILFATQQVHREAQQFASVPFQFVASHLTQQRDFDLNALLRVMFIYREQRPRVLGLGEVETIPNLTAKVELGFYLHREPNSFRLEIEYNSDLFTASTTNSLLLSYRQHLHLLTQNDPLLPFEFPVGVHYAADT